MAIAALDQAGQAEANHADDPHQLEQSGEQRQAFKNAKKGAVDPQNHQHGDQTGQQGDRGAGGLPLLLQLAAGDPLLDLLD